MSIISITVRYTVEVPADIARDISKNPEEYSTQGVKLEDLTLYARGSTIPSKFVEYETEEVTCD